MGRKKSEEEDIGKENRKEIKRKRRKLQRNMMRRNFLKNEGNNEIR